MIALILSEKNQGIPSSGIQFCFWGALVIYASIKLRTLILLRKDQVCIYVLLLSHYEQVIIVITRGLIA